MQFDTKLAWVPNLEDAIERDPLIVTPDTPLMEAIALIGRAHSHACLLMEEAASSERPAKGVRASCAIVMQDRTMLGILTERDVVRLTAKAIDFQEATVADVMVHPVITLPERSVHDIFAALFLFRRYRIRHLPIADDRGQLVGVISNESIRQVLRPANLLRFRRVSDVMKADVIRAHLSTTVLALAKLMAKHRVSCIVIVQLDAEDNEQPVGIVTERDIVQFQAFQIDLGKTEAETVMSSPLFLLSPEDSLWTAHQEMQKRRVGRLVVSWNWGKGLGIVTQTSLLRVFDPIEMYGVIENLQQTIQQMEAKHLEPLPCSPSLSLEPPLASSQQSSSKSAKATISPSSSSIAGDREIPLSLLDSIYETVKHLLANPEISVQQRQQQLKSVLDAANRAINNS